METANPRDAVVRTSTVLLTAPSWVISRPCHRTNRALLPAMAGQVYRGAEAHAPAARFTFSERRPETVRRGGDLNVVQESQQSRDADWATAQAREHDRTTPVFPQNRDLENVHGASVQWNPVLSFGPHAAGGGINTCAAGDGVTSRRGLRRTAPRCGRKLDRQVEGSRRARAPHLADRPSEFVVRQCAPVFHKFCCGPTTGPGPWRGLSTRHSVATAPSITALMR